MSSSRAIAVAIPAALSALCLWFVLYALVLSGLQEAHAQHLLYNQLRYNLEQATTPLGGAIKPGTPVAYMTAPGIGLSAVVVEGTSSAELANGPGLMPTSSLPGQAGNAEILGRSSLYGGPFRKVHMLRPNDVIKVTTGQGKFAFRVIDVRGPGDPVPSAAQLGQASLTLVTSAGKGLQSWSADHVIYADAALVTGQVQPAPSGRPTVALPIDQPMAADTGALQYLLVIVWLAVLLLASIGLAVAYTWWTGWQVWVVGLPTVLAALWLATNAAMQLMPNLT